METSSEAAVDEILSRARRARVALTVRGAMIIARPKGATPPDLANAIRNNKAVLLLRLTRPEPRAIAPDSRQPLISPEVRSKIEAIEAEARAKGWPAELLWNGQYWDLPRGLAAVLDGDDEIVEVRQEQIAILKLKRDVLRFHRHAS